MRKLSSADRAGVISRAEHALIFLNKALDALRREDGDVEEWIVTWIDGTYHRLFRNERALPWLMFARAIDHASRQALANPLFPDSERAKIARGYFARTYADLDARLDDAKVVAAMTAWRTQKNHWKAMRAAVKCFMTNAPNTTSMSRMWQDFPHLSAPKRSIKSPKKYEK